MTNNFCSNNYGECLLYSNQNFPFAAFTVDRVLILQIFHQPFNSAKGLSGGVPKYQIDTLESPNGTLDFYNSSVLKAV